MANQIRITYGDFEKYLKIYEFAMKNGNFIIFFLANFGKSVFYYGGKVISQGMAGRADFSRICFFFAQGICTFFVSCLEKNGENAPFF